MQPTVRRLWMCCIVRQDFDSFQCTYWPCNLNKHAHKANTYLLRQRLGSAELQEFILNEKAIHFLADIWEFGWDGAKAGVFSPKKTAGTEAWWECVWWSGRELWRTQKDELKRQRDEKKRECDRRDNVHDVDEIYKCVTNWVNREKMKTTKTVGKWEDRGRVEKSNRDKFIKQMLQSTK